MCLITTMRTFPRTAAREDQALLFGRNALLSWICPFGQVRRNTWVGGVALATFLLLIFNFHFHFILCLAFVFFALLYWRK